MFYVEFKFTPTAVFVEFISPTDFTPRMNSHLNSNSSCPLLESLKVAKSEYHLLQLRKSDWVETIIGHSIALSIG